MAHGRRSRSYKYLIPLVLNFEENGVGLTAGFNNTKISLELCDMK